MRGSHFLLAAVALFSSLLGVRSPVVALNMSAGYVGCSFSETCVPFDLLTYETDTPLTRCRADMERA